MTKPDITKIKIRCHPQGEILILATDNNPQNFTTKITLSVFAVNEPNCTNNAVEALWNGDERAYIGTGTFDGELIPDTRGYDASVEFFLNTTSVGLDTNIPVEVEAVPLI